MKPKPFSALNHFTVPCATVVLLVAVPHGRSPERLSWPSRAVPTRRARKRVRLTARVRSSASVKPLTRKTTATMKPPGLRRIASPLMPVLVRPGGSLTEELREEPLSTITPRDRVSRLSLHRGEHGGASQTSSIRVTNHERVSVITFFRGQRTRIPARQPGEAGEGAHLDRFDTDSRQKTDHDAGCRPGNHPRPCGMYRIRKRRQQRAGGAGGGLACRGRPRAEGRRRRRRPT